MQDLRVCLKSADKELKEVKEEKRDEKRSHDGKISTYIHRVCGRFRLRNRLMLLLGC